jgi:alpha-tubulin suppressor-like RCC1 family protein
VDVKLGSEFNLFLAKSGTVWISGAITQEGEHVVDTYGGLINLSNRMTDKNRVPFKRIECGYSHALLISKDDKAYAFGAGLYGQLGLGTEELKAKCPLPIADVNDDKVLMIACGANFSLCYTTLGIVYQWGMLVPEDYGNISFYPNFLTVSYPRVKVGASIIEEMESWESFVLTDIKATYREILACDVSGRIYHCDLNYTQTLKPYDGKL